MTPSHLRALVVMAVSLGYFAIVANFRQVDDDEGYYLLAAADVARGELPYRDFFFPQLPLAPYVYGVWQTLWGASIVSARVLGVVLSSAAAALLYLSVDTEAGPLAGVVAAVGYCAHVLTFEWAVTAKTFPLAMLLVVSVPFFTARAQSQRALHGVGLLLAAMLALRALLLPMVVAVVAVLIWRRGLRAVTPVLSAFALGLIPLAALWLMDVDRFLFDTATYHALRHPGGGWVKDPAQKLGVLKEVLLSPLFANRPDVTGLQTTPVLFAVLLVLLRFRRASLYCQSAALSALSLALSALLPSPAWSQYFAPVVPLGVAVGAIELARVFKHRWALWLTLAVYGGCAVPTFIDRVLRSPEHLRPAAVDAIARRLGAVVPEGGRVASHWPSYLVASGRRPIAAARNQFVLQVAARLSEAERRRYQVFTLSEFQRQVDSDAQGFVAGAFSRPATGRALVASGWSQRAALHGATVWAPAGVP